MFPHSLCSLSAYLSKIPRFSSAIYLRPRTITHSYLRTGPAPASVATSSRLHTRITPHFLFTRLKAADGRSSPFTLLDLIPQTPYSEIAELMYKTGHYKWGFTIYRTAYEDEELWNSFLARMRQSAQERLKYRGRWEQLDPLLTWTVIQDPDGLNHASRAAVRSHFQEWIQGTSSARDGEGAERARDRGAPQYTYCLIVDASCLERYRTVRDDIQMFMSNDVPLVVIPAHWNADDYDGRWIPEVDDEEDRKHFDFPEVEGSTSPLLDWMLVDQGCLIGFYSQLLTSGWYDAYVRPPRVYPDETDDRWKIRG